VHTNNEINKGWMHKKRYLGYNIFEQNEFHNQFPDYPYNGNPEYIPCITGKRAESKSGTHLPEKR
jgi:hypothetical protein